MATTTVSCFSIEELQQDVDGIDEAAATGPVFIVRPGRPSLVLLTEEEYGKMGGASPNILQLLAFPKGVGEIDFEPPHLTGVWHRDVDLSD